MHGLCLHEQQLAATIHSTIHYANARNHTPVCVVLRIKDQRLKWRIGVTLRRRNADNNFVQQLGHTDPSLCRDSQDIFSRNA